MNVIQVTAADHGLGQSQGDELGASAAEDAEPTSVTDAEVAQPADDTIAKMAITEATLEVRPTANPLLISCCNASYLVL